jgi:hypothetical protein
MKKPKVVRYARLYDIFVFVMYTFLSIPLSFYPFRTANDRDPLLFCAPIALFIVPIYLLLFSMPFMLGWKGKYPYYGQLILIALGFGSIITIIPSIFLLLSWIKAEVKKYYEPKEGMLVARGK